MRIKDVVTLKEVVSDLNDGKAFYDQRETGGGVSHSHNTTACGSAPGVSESLSGRSLIMNVNYLGRVVQ